jgi:hypothetical protein
MVTVTSDRQPAYGGRRRNVVIARHAHPDPVEVTLITSAGLAPKKTRTGVSICWPVIARS